MNKIYRVIYNQATQTWTAVTELAKAKGKSSSAAIVSDTNQHKLSHCNQKGALAFALLVSCLGWSTSSAQVTQVTDSSTATNIMLSGGGVPHQQPLAQQQKMPLSSVIAHSHNQAMPLS